MKPTFQEADLIQLTQDLVGIPSINPILSDDPDLRGEHRMAEFLGQRLQKAGFSVSLPGNIPGRPNVMAKMGLSRPSRRLIIEGHLDTQGIHGMIVPPFEGRIEGGRIYGRGACDMKGPMAAALVNLTPTRLQQYADAGVELVFIGAVGEETGNLGAIELASSGVGADEILVLEPTDLHIVHAHKGAFWFEVEIQGLAAHGSNPSKGLNAIKAMTPVIEAIEEQVSKSDCASKLLGRPTVNIGTIRGGSSVNIVPDRCVIQVDRRTTPGEQGSGILNSIRASLEVMVSRGIFKGFELRTIKEGVPFETGADTSLVRRLSAACEESGVKAVTEGAAWYSDAGPFSKTCREVAVFGPGSIAQAHTADEFIEIAELIKGAHIIDRFLDRLLHHE